MNKSNLQLFECVFELDTNIQFGRIKDDEYERCSPNKPLHHVVEGITSFLLPTILDDAGCVNERHLFEQLGRHFNALQSLKERLPSADKKIQTEAV